MESMWKKFGAFVRRVPIFLLSHLTIHAIAYLLQYTVHVHKGIKSLYTIYIHNIHTQW